MGTCWFFKTCVGFWVTEIWNPHSLKHLQRWIHNIFSSWCTNLSKHHWIWHRLTTETQQKHIPDIQRRKRRSLLGCYGQSNIDLSEAVNHWTNKKKETCASGNKYLCIVIMCNCTMVGTQIWRSYCRRQRQLNYDRVHRLAWVSTNSHHHIDSDHSFPWA